MPVLMLKSKKYIDAVIMNKIAEGFDTPIGVRWMKPATTITAAKKT
jgi:hypothetical protein